MARITHRKEKTITVYKIFCLTSVAIYVTDSRRVLKLNTEVACYLMLRTVKFRVYNTHLLSYQPGLI
jgi:hypothetical protein